MQCQTLLKIWSCIFILRAQKREFRNYCQSAMVLDFFCFLVICYDVPLFVASCKITAEYPFVTVMPKLKTKGYLLWKTLLIQNVWWSFLLFNPKDWDGITRRVYVNAVGVWHHASACIHLRIDYIHHFVMIPYRLRRIPYTPWRDFRSIFRLTAMIVSTARAVNWEGILPRILR